MTSHPLSHLQTAYRALHPHSDWLPLSWNALSTDDWSKLLPDNPEFASHCPWNRLDGDAWFWILKEQPQFADRCPWSRLKPCYWPLLLLSHPEFADHCPWPELTPTDWALLLADHPQFADKCDWSKMRAEGKRPLSDFWVHLFKAQPQFLDRIDLDSLDIDSCVLLLAHLPESAARFTRWDEITPEAWLQEILPHQPQFADKCDWSKLAPRDFFTLFDTPTLPPSPPTAPKTSSPTGASAASPSRGAPESELWTGFTRFAGFFWRADGCACPDSNHPEVWAIGRKWVRLCRWFPNPVNLANPVQKNLQPRPSPLHLPQIQKEHHPVTIDELTHAVIGATMTVHTRLGPGFLEEVYQNALLLELAKQNLPAQKEVPLDVRYDGVCVGQYQADLIVERRLILELKAVSDLHPRHEAQLVNYLAATGIDDGLLLNFGTPSLQFKHKYRLYKKTK